MCTFSFIYFFPHIDFFIIYSTHTNAHLKYEANQKQNHMPDPHVMKKKTVSLGNEI